MALADGLSDDQRAGRRPSLRCPRPAGGLADELQRRLRAHGDEVCRALVVAAAEHGGEVAAVRAALTTLGESGEGLVAAETAGLVEVVGTRVVFADPWTRAASYHLVAPASRRAGPPCAGRVVRRARSSGRSRVASGGGCRRTQRRGGRRVGPARRRHGPAGSDRLGRAHRRAGSRVRGRTCRAADATCWPHSDGGSMPPGPTA